MYDEATYYITPDGIEFRLDDRAAPRYLNSIDGLGMPPLRHVTRRGYQQDGETWLAAQLSPRTINLQVTEVYASRIGMFDGHRDWFAMLRPGADAGALRKVLPDGRAYEVDVRFQSGLDAGPQDRLGHRVQTYTMQLVAHDPVWRSVEARTAGAAGSAGAQKVYPYVYPYWYDGDVTFDDFVIVYAGSWRAYPTITLTGPMGNPTLTHVERAARLQLLHFIPSGAFAVIAPDPDGPVVQDQNGVNLFGRLAGDSDLAGFYLEPGVNTIHVHAQSMGANSQVALVYYEMHLGV
ncbi:MAG: phage tail family protein [Anaerolineae bacterium]|nr:phage tail family protein [Anaerolineae bacterium]